MLLVALLLQLLVQPAEPVKTCVLYEDDSYACGWFTFTDEGWTLDRSRGQWVTGCLPDGACQYRPLP